MSEMPAIARNFWSRAEGNSMCGVIGVVDGSHIPIIQPHKDQSPLDYYNRKKFNSIVLQGIVDSSYRFIDVYCGSPGSFHDARVYRRSPIGRRLNMNTYHIIYHLIADSAYSNNNTLATPYKRTPSMPTPLTDEQKTYNAQLSSIRVYVEIAFGLLKGRWRRLRMVDFSRANAPNAVVACCVLQHIPSFS
jgi:hypothetical protein